MICEPTVFYEPTLVRDAVRDRLDAAHQSGERVDYVAFVPDGEPTLDVHLGTTIALVRQLGVPVAVITNGSLLWLPDVRRRLAEADWVSVKVDAADEHLWRRIDRPHPSLAFERVLEGIAAFAREFAGELVTESMIVPGVNDRDEDLEAIAELVRQLEPAHAYLSTPTRPAAESWVHAEADEARLRHWCSVMSRKVPVVELLTGYEGSDFVSTGDMASDLLAITAVHPMREDAVCELLEQSGAPWSLVERLLAEGRLISIPYGGHVFYRRAHRHGRPER